MTKDRSIPAVIARLRFGDSDGDDHDIAADTLERLTNKVAALTLVAYGTPENPKMRDPYRPANTADVERSTESTAVEPKAEPMCKHDDGDCHEDDPCDDCPKFPVNREAPHE